MPLHRSEGRIFRRVIAGLQALPGCLLNQCEKRGHRHLHDFDEPRDGLDARIFRGAGFDVGNGLTPQYEAAGVVTGQTREAALRQPPLVTEAFEHFSKARHVHAASVGDYVYARKHGKTLRLNDLAVCTGM